MFLGHHWLSIEQTARSRSVLPFPLWDLELTMTSLTFLGALSSSWGPENSFYILDMKLTWTAQSQNPNTGSSLYQFGNHGLNQAIEKERHLLDPLFSFLSFIFPSLSPLFPEISIAYKFFLPQLCCFPRNSGAFPAHTQAPACHHSYSQLLWVFPRQRRFKTHSLRQNGPRRRFTLT